MLTRSWRGRGRRDERGSIIVALTVILVIMAIASAVAYRVIGNQGAVLTRQNVSSGVAGADAGVSDALFRLDQGPTGTGAGTYFCVNPSDGNCVSSSIPGAPGVSYVARSVNASSFTSADCPVAGSSTQEWVIQALGTTHGQKGAIQETAVQCSKFPFALFGQNALTFNGNASAAFSTYNDTEPPNSGGGDPNPNPNGNVAIGSNGTITCNGGLGSNVTAVYYGTGGIGSLGSSCGNPKSYSTTYYLPPPVAPTTPVPFACPGTNGQIGSAYGVSVLTPGTYLCNTPVTISGQLNVSGAVSLYIMLDPSQYNSNTNALTIIRSSYVNDMSDYCAANSGASGCNPTPDLPNAENLQIFSNSNGTFGNDNGQGYYFGGVIYAPQASLTQDGCKSQYYGALVINTLTCNGGPHLSVSYDSRLGTYYGPWSASNYVEINPSSVSIP